MSKPSTQSFKRIFIDTYLRNGFNATKAFREVFPDRKFKTDFQYNNAASTLFRDAYSQEYLNERLEQRKKELRIDQHYVVNKLIDIVEADVMDLTQKMTENQIKEIPENLRKLVSSIEIDKTDHTWTERYGREDHEESRTMYKVTFMSKDKALESLAKHTGLYIKDNVNVNIEAKSFTDALKDLDF